MGRHSTTIIEERHDIGSYMRNLVAALEYAHTQGGLRRSPKQRTQGPKSGTG
jgi:hypothetical protein